MKDMKETNEGSTTGGPLLLEAARLLEGVDGKISAEIIKTSSLTNDVPIDSDEQLKIDESLESNKKWNELTWRGRLYRVIIQGFGKLAALLILLYMFVCSLDLLSSAFRLVGGRAAGAAFSNSELLQNPVAGLMIGVLATVLVQSSSTSTSITVTMVASGILSVRPAIPIIMGANIGTSVTNTIVSLAQSSNKEEFRRAFSGATVHDMFNWLTVFTLLPLEILTGYLYHLTNAIVSGIRFQSVDRMSGSAVNNDLLKTITKPFTDIIVQLDKSVIEGNAVNDPTYMDKRLMKVWCGFKQVKIEMNITETMNITSDYTDLEVLTNVTNLQNTTTSVPLLKCSTLLAHIDLGDAACGALLLILSLALLCSCLVLLVRLLHSALSGPVMRAIHHVINAGSHSPVASYLAGYVALLVGALLTMLVQSSSVFTSALTPLVGVGVVKLERMYPLTLGSNVGTTTTGLLAAMAADATRLRPAVQIALVHLFFNLSGILLFYPIPSTRIPIKLARIMGDTTARYRWFAVFYVLLMFFLLPLLVFSLSMISSTLMLSVVVLALAVFLSIIIINILQRRKPRLLPELLRDWSFLPLALRSLDPLDHKIHALVKLLSHCACCHCTRHLVTVTSEETKNKQQEEYDHHRQFVITHETKVNDDDDNDDDGDDDRYTPTVVRYPDCESGYVSNTTTPWNTPANTPGGPTPCISRLSSCAIIHEVCDEDEEEEHCTSGDTDPNVRNENTGRGNQVQACDEIADDFRGLVLLKDSDNINGVEDEFKNRRRDESSEIRTDSSGDSNNHGPVLGLRQEAYSRSGRRASCVSRSNSRRNSLVNSRRVEASQVSDNRGSQATDVRGQQTNHRGAQASEIMGQQVTELRGTQSSVQSGQQLVELTGQQAPVSRGIRGTAWDESHQELVDLATVALMQGKIKKDQKTPSRGK